MKFVLQFQCDCEIIVGDNFVVCSFWQFILDIDEEVSLRPSSPHYAHKLPPSVHTTTHWRVSTARQGQLSKLYKAVFCVLICCEPVTDHVRQVFSCFAPVELKRALVETNKLIVPRTPAFKGLDIMAIGNLVVVAVMYGVVYTQLIAPQNDILEEVGLLACQHLASDPIIHH